MTTELPPTPFAKVDLSLPDDQLGIQFYAVWADLQAQKLGISQITPEIAELLRLMALSLDTSNEDLAGVEKALRIVAAQADFARGGQMFRQYMNRFAIDIGRVDELKTGRRRQRDLARKPRRDAIGKLISEIMTRDPSITEPRMREEFRKRAGEEGKEFRKRAGEEEIISEVNDDEETIDWWNGNKLKKMTFPGLKHRMSRARKKREPALQKT